MRNIQSLFSSQKHSMASKLYLTKLSMLYEVCFLRLSNTAKNINYRYGWLRILRLDRSLLTKVASALPFCSLYRVQGKTVYEYWRWQKPNTPPMNSMRSPSTAWNTNIGQDRMAGKPLLLAGTLVGILILAREGVEIKAGTIISGRTQTEGAKNETE